MPRRVPWTGTSPFSKRASAQTREAAKSGIYDGGVIQLNQNESARGPGPEGPSRPFRPHTNKRMGRGYSPDHVNELREVIAGYYKVGTGNVQLATGSTPLLQGSARAFSSATKAFVTPMPTYSTSLATARRIGAKTIGGGSGQLARHRSRRAGGGVPRRRPGLSLQSEQPHRHGARTWSRRAFREPRAA